MEEKSKKELKVKIIVFLVGLLIGAGISAGSFIAYMLINNNEPNCIEAPHGAPENGGVPPEMPSENMDKSEKTPAGAPNVETNPEEDDSSTSTKNNTSEERENRKVSPPNSKTNQEEVNQ